MNINTAFVSMNNLTHTFDTSRESFHKNKLEATRINMKSSWFHSDECDVLDDFYDESQSGCSDY